MKIRIEANSLATKNLSGIGYFAKRLTEALIQNKQAGVEVFTFNFLQRQPIPAISGVVTQRINRLFPLRVYAKLQSHRLAPAFDAHLGKADLTIFTNFARWPSLRTRYTATAVHDLTFLKYPELMEVGNLAHLKRVVKQAIRSSDFIITVSEAVKLELAEEFSLGLDRIVAIPVPPDETFYKKNSNEVHKKYGIPTKKYLFFISTIEPRKNIPLLIDAYSRLPKKLQSEYSLVLSGGMGWKSETSIAALKKAQKSGLNVVHTGYIDEADKSALYQQSSAFVFPSVYEGFGMPVLEAAASKTPIIATDIPVLREAGGPGAEYFIPENVDSLSKAIAKVLTDEALRKKLVKNASAHLATFSWETNAQKIVDKVNELEHLRKSR